MSEKELSRWSWGLSVKLNHEDHACQIFVKIHEHPEDGGIYYADISAYSGIYQMLKHRVEAKTLGILKNRVENIVSKIVFKVDEAISSTLREIDINNL